MSFMFSDSDDYCLSTKNYEKKISILCSMLDKQECPGIKKIDCETVTKYLVPKEIFEKIQKYKFPLNDTIEYLYGCYKNSWRSG